MGLDIALGLMILLGAIRGWFRGFVLQALQLGGLVGCVYAAGPIRDRRAFAAAALALAVLFAGNNLPCPARCTGPSGPHSPTAS